ncbi:MAG: hypothetical protein COU09_00145 [Candidatus Harrisonbacteria bacterium CG10_big_fil_rev_8_21_14_0_10_44_23]|uniref:Uncharacterized protein n=1 Tax=Candidatus Harrisonbacteria bacterium CG10_big_fil_rev_8_21_14_0_10_44_23 TaxID=1974585 RepID=A0A2H0UR17_9BACT|nr:MAG: hypothetical protein COU09_00145 [Candidatus Harrisonbacteria bacterium CG10_big_fil_rev_8_21_14_0_10_44_23]
MTTKPKKYTREYVLGEVNDLLSRLRTSKEYVFKGELVEEKPYSRQRISEWADAFMEDEEISDTIRKIDDILETRAFVGGLKRQFSTAMVKFHLTNNHGWIDKPKIAESEKMTISKLLLAIDE